MDAKLFLELASHLSRSMAPNPASYRSATSRAYYAAFNALSEMFSDLGIIISTGPTCHGQIKGLINNTQDQELNKVRAKFNQLGSFRRQSDYEMNNIESEKQTTAQLTVKLADSIFMEIQKIRADKPRRQAIRKSVREYAPKVGIKIDPL